MSVGELIVKNGGLYLWRGDQAKPRDLGFEFKSPHGIWGTKDPFKAYQLIDYADEAATRCLLSIEDNISDSLATWTHERIPAPEGLSYYDFQRAGIIQAARSRVTYIADSMGLGKTIQAIGISNLLGLKTHLILCPAIMREKWETEIKKWAVGRLSTKAYYSSHDEIYYTDCIIISYALFTQYRLLYDKLKSIKFDHIIIDEAHNVSNPDTKINQMINNAEGFVRNAGKVTLLSGTPNINRLDNIFRMLKSFRPDVLLPSLVDYYDFIQRYCEYYVDNGVKITGSKNERELGLRLRGSGFMIRRSIRDVYTQLPGRIDSLVHVCEGKAAEELLAAESGMGAQEVRKMQGTGYFGGPKERKEFGLLKIKESMGFIIELMSHGKLLIGAYHRDVIAELCEKLKDFHPLKIDGSTLPKKRSEILDKFRNSMYNRILIANILAMKEGIDLVEVNRVVMFESAWDPSVNEQFIARVLRIGQKRTVFVYHITIKNSIEAYVINTYLEKAKGFRGVFDSI